MAAPSPRERARRNVTGIVSTLVTGIWLAALFTDQDWWLAALLVGYVVVVPITAMVFGDEAEVAEWWDDGDEWAEEDDSATDAAQSRERPDAHASSPPAGPSDPGESALERIRRRYAEGELTDEQFERKLERLLETETLEDVEERRWARDRERQLRDERTDEEAAGGEPEPETERS